MTTQLRYRTLVAHLSLIYEAGASGRTGCLKNGLDEIVSVINPTTPAEWLQVKQDSERLLKVWLARSAGQGTRELMDEIVDALASASATSSFSAATAAVATTPVLVITEKEGAHVSSSADPIMHIPSYAVHRPSPLSLPLPLPLPSYSLDEDEEEVAEEDEVEEAEEAEEEAEEAEAEEAEEAEAEEEADEEAEEAEVEEAEEADEEAEEEEAEEAEEAEAEEEEGLEVKKEIIRGRSYWMDVKTNDLYAITDDDDIGDQVGTIKDGKPVFLSTK